MLIEEGKLTGKKMINNMVSENNILKWILRVVGIIMIIAGYISILNPIAKLTSRIPFLGNLVGGTIALIGLVHSLAVIAKLR